MVNQLQERKVSMVRTGEGMSEHTNSQMHSDENRLMDSHYVPSTVGIARNTADRVLAFMNLVS